MKLVAHLTFLTSTLRLPHFRTIIKTFIFLADGAGRSRQVGFAEHVFTEVHARKPLNGCVTNFYFRIESGSSRVRTFGNWGWKIMNPLYNADAKPF